MIYGVFGGCYSDWYSVGYFDNRLEADKYCALSNGEYYVIELKNLKDEKDLSKVTLKYKYEVVFDFKNDSWIMRDEPDRYKCYISDYLEPNMITDGRFSWNGRFSWIRFDINIDKEDRKLAEKIAQDYLYQLLAMGNSKTPYDKNIKLMNDEFARPTKEREKRKKEEELRQKELTELERLKAKYE